MTRNVQDGPGLPVGMVSIGDALQGFLTVLEERCNQPESPDRTVPDVVPYGTPAGRMEGTETRKAPAMLSTSEGVNDYLGVANE